MVREGILRNVSRIPTMTAFRPGFLLLSAAFLGLAVLSAPLAQAAGGSSDSPQVMAPADPDFTAGKAAIDRNDWAAAVPLFQKVVEIGRAACRERVSQYV